MIFGNEAGGHRWQRVPPTETRGRIQTSTVTVAILNIPETVTISLDTKDLEITTMRGSGPGGQHRNKTESCVTVKHIPSGTIVRCDAERSQHQNKALALKILNAKLADTLNASIEKSANAARKQQIGSGMRGDKIRTYRVKDNICMDHRSGKKYRLDDWFQGK